MNANKLEKLKNSKQMACDGWVYSIQRMDLLIITISGAGVYIILETFKESMDKHMQDLHSIKWAGLAFVLSIIINFISQWTGQKSNLNHIIMIDELIASGDKPTTDQQIKINNHDSYSSTWSTLTNMFNIANMVLMFLGLSLICSYFFFNF